jgi:hypothetical protein
MSIQEFYQSPLNLVGLKVDPKDGYTIGTPVDPDDPESVIEPVKVPEADKRFLMFPSDAYLDKDAGTGGDDEPVVFHPLCESVNHAESPVIDLLRRFGTFTLSTRAFLLAEEIITLALNKDATENLSARQAEMLSNAINDPKSNTLTEFRKLQKTGCITVANFLNFYVKREGVYQDQSVLRLATVRSPVCETFSDKFLIVNDSEPLSKQVYFNTKKLVHFLVGEANEGTFDYGSNNNVAPYFDALMHALCNVQDHLNSVATMFKEYLDPKSFEFIYQDTSFVKQHNKFRKMVGELPSFPFNNGENLHGGDGYQNSQLEPQKTQVASQPDLTKPSEETSGASNNGGKRSLLDMFEEDTAQQNQWHQEMNQVQGQFAPRGHGGWGQPNPMSGGWGSPQSNQSNWGAPQSNQGGWGAPQSNTDGWGTPQGGRFSPR